MAAGAYKFWRVQVPRTEVKEAGFSVRYNARNSMQRVAVRAPSQVVARYTWQFANSAVARPAKVEQN